MPDVAALNVTITADTRDLESGVARAEKSVAGLGATMSSVLTGIGVGVGMKAFDGIVSGFEAAGKAAIGFNSNMEQSTIAFTSMLGSAEKAQAFLDEMKQFAATTPFEFPDLLQASKQMMAFGFAAKDVKPLLTSVGSAAAAMGTGRSGVDSITKALGQMRAATVVQAGELNQLTEQGVPAFQILADAMGISTGEVKKLASEGKIASDVFIKAFQTWADSKYGDMMSKQALTFEGAMSNIKDSLTFAVAEGFKPFFEALSAGAVQFSQFVQSDTFSTWAKNLATTTRDAFRQIGDAVRTVQQVLAGDWAPSDSIEPFTLAVGNAAVMLRDTLGPAIATAGAILQQLSGWFTENIAPIAAFVGGFTGAIATAGLFTAAIAAVTAVLTLLLSPLGLVAIAVGLLAAAWTTNFLGIQEATAAAWAYLLPIFTQIVDWLGPKITAVLNWLTTTGWPMMLAAATAVGNWITTVAIPALTQLVDWLGPKITAVLTWLTTTGWPALVAAAMTVSDWITGTAIPALTQLVDWLGPKISAVVTWLTSTGWPGLVTAGEAVWAVVQEIIRFFQLLYAELDKREVFTTLARLWDELVAAGDKVWAVIKKMDEIFRPFQQLTAEFNSGPGAALVGTFGLIGTSGDTAGKGIDVVALAAQSMGKMFEIALMPLKRFLDDLKALGELIEKAKSWTLPNLTGGGMPSGGIGTMSFSGGSSDPSEYLAQAALARGIDPNQVLAVMGREGPGGWGATGSFNTGTSYGPLQLHYAGGPNPQQGMGDAFTRATGIDLRTDQSLGAHQRAIDYALDQLSATGDYREWYGAEPALGSRFTPVRRVAPSSAPGRMDRIPLGGGGVGGGAPGSDPSQWPGFMNQVNEQLPDYLTSLETIQGKGTLAFNGTAQAATVAATAVVQQMNLMQTGALTSVTNLGTGFLTTVQTTAGTAIATVTDMAGQITTQYATLANGVTLNAGAMQTGVLTATTAMHDGTILSVQDMAGNAIVTVTDMTGQVTSQYVNMAATSGETLTEFAALNLEQFGAVAESALQPIEPIDQLGSALADIPQADMSDTVKQFGEAAQAAKKAQAAIKALADATEDLPGSFGGSKSGSGKSSGLSKKAAGGWASGLTLVGEEGPELLSLNRPHYVTPNSALSGGGQTIVVNLNVEGSLIHEQELTALIGREVPRAMRAGRMG